MEENQRREVKKYYDDALWDKLIKIIPPDTYGDFTGSIIHILMRRKAEFDLPEEQILEEAQNFRQNVETISFVDPPDPKNNYTGVFRGEKKAIEINFQHFKKMEESGWPPEAIYQDLFETLTHEVYHGINYYPKENRLGLVDTVTSKGTGLNEILTEAAADRASITRNPQEIKYGVHHTKGYPSITFVSELLSTALGVTEKELLRAGLQDRGKISQLIDSRTENYDIENGKSVVSTINDKYLDKIIANIDIIHNLDYGDNKSRFKRMNDRKVKEIRAANLESLFTSIFELASYELANDNRGLNDGIDQESNFRIKRLDGILNSVLRNYVECGNLTNSQAKKIGERIFYGPRIKLQEQVAGISSLYEEQEKVPDSQKTNALSEAKRGLLASSISRRQKYGLTPILVARDVVASGKNGNHFEYILSEDYDRDEYWDNEDAIQNMEGLYITEKNRRQELGILQDGKKENIFKRIFNFFKHRGQKSLPEGRGESIGGSAKTTVREDDDFYVLHGEKLSEYKSNVKKRKRKFKRTKR